MHSLPVPEPTLNRVVLRAADVFGIPADDIMAKTRRGRIPEARFAVCAALAGAGYRVCRIHDALPAFAAKETIRLGILRALELEEVDPCYAKKLAATRAAATA